MQFENKHCIFSLSKTGAISGLKLKKDGRSLIAETVPFCEIILKDGSCDHSVHMEPREAGYAVTFSKTPGEVLLRISTREEYFVIGVISADVPELKDLRFAVLAPAPKKYTGSLLGMSSDDEVGVCLRSLNWETMTEVSAEKMYSFTYRLNHTFSGCNTALIGAFREDYPSILQKMTIAENVPYSPCGGAWALQDEKTRGSYIFGDIHGEDIDRWISIAKRGGFRILHFHEWWTCLGHYIPKKKFFPGGFPQLKECFDKLHAAGLEGGLHMLSGCIDPKDSWVTPVPSGDLCAREVYTLAEELRKDDMVVTVEECPTNQHHLFMTYAGNGNVLKIDDELIQYEEISREKPYCFLKCTRGAFGTVPAEHSKGARTDYLLQRYLAFYPRVGSPLFYELMENIGTIYHGCKADMIYMDGAEGIGERNEADFFRWELYKRVSPALMQTSDWSHNIWWFCSGLGAMDIPMYGPKNFIDMHVRISGKYLKSDLLPCQMGWWVFLGATREYRTQTIDVTDYFGSKVLALDAEMSIQMVDAQYEKMQNGRIFDMLTILGWYEYIRLARYFKPESIAGAGEPGKEFRMRLNKSGLWKFRSIHPQIFKSEGGKECWKWNSPDKDQKLNFRLETLYRCSEESPKILADFSEDCTFEKGNVTRSTLQEEISGVGKCVQTRLIAENSSDTSRGAWVQIGQDHPVPYFNLEKSEAISVWVKGDNSGALLNFQLHCPQEFLLLRSEHYITLNFSGWKHFELHFRERSAERINDYLWPYDETEGNHSVYGTIMNREHVDQISAFINEIPAHGKVDVAFTPLIGHPLKEVILPKTEFSLNGERFTLPFELKSDESAELEDGILSHYDAKGFLLERFPFRTPDVRAGENVLEGTFGTRAELRLFTLGEEFGERNPAFDRTLMAEELELPLGITDHEAETPFAVRAGETAKVSVELYVSSAESPVKNIELALDDKVYSFKNAILNSRMCLTCKEREWIITDEKQNVCGKGVLSESLPEFKTSEHRMKITFDCEGKHLAFLHLKKEYL